MFKRKNLKVALIMLVGLLALVGCDLNMQQKTGDLKIEFNDLKPKSGTTINPDKCLNLNHYSVKGEGPNGNHFQKCNCSKKSVIISDLVLGEWSITVFGYNEDNIEIGEGTSSITIKPGKSNSLTVPIVECSGEGTLDYELSWPDKTLSNPKVIAKLTKMSDESGEDSQLLDFTIDSENPKATYNGKLSVGSYSLSVKLFKQDCDVDDKPLYGRVYSVRIVKDSISTYKESTTGEDLNIFSNLDLEVENRIKAPFDIEVSPATSSIYEGETVDFVADTESEDIISYFWYFDGDFQKKTTVKNFTIPNSLSIGNHFIDLIALKNGISSSAKAKIEIKELKPVVKVKFTLPEIDNEEHIIEMKYGIKDYKTAMSDPETMGITEIPLGSLKSHLIIMPEAENNSRFNIVSFLNNDSFTPTTFSEKSNSFLFMSFPFKDEIQSSPNIMQFIDTSTECDYDNLVFGFFADNTNMELNDIKIGEVGKMVSGSISVNNVPVNTSKNLNNPYDESKMEKVGVANVTIDFQMIRGEDIYMYSLLFDSNMEDISNVSSKAITKGLTVSVPNSSMYIKDGYVFKEWNTKADGTGIAYHEGDTFVMPDSNFTLYAIWNEDN